MPRIATNLLTAALVVLIISGPAQPVHAQQSRSTDRKTTTPQRRGARNAAPRQRTAQPRRGTIKPAAAEQQPRPQGNAVLNRKPLPPGVLKLLKDWEENTKQHKRLEATKVEKYEYDKTFFIERRGICDIKFEDPDKAALTVVPMEIPNGEISRRKSPAGKPYDLKGVSPERWVCTGMEIIEIDDDAKTYHVLPIPPQLQGQNITEGPIPFLFGLSAKEAQERYDFYRLKPNPRFPNSFSFRAVPRRQVDAQEYKYADVILDLDRYVPIGIRVIDPTGNKETVYHFPEKHVEINPKQNFWDRGPFIKPNIKGYKLVGNGNADAPLPGAPAPRQANPGAPPEKAGRLRIGGGSPTPRSPARK